VQGQNLNKGNQQQKVKNIYEEKYGLDERGCVLIQLNANILGFLTDILTIGAAARKSFHNWESTISGRSAVQILVAMWWREEERLQIAGNVNLRKPNEYLILPPTQAATKDLVHKLEKRLSNSVIDEGKLKNITIQEPGKWVEYEEVYGTGGMGHEIEYDMNALEERDKKNLTLKVKDGSRFTVKPLPHVVPFLLSNEEHPLQGVRSELYGGIFEAIREKQEKEQKKEELAVVQDQMQQKEAEEDSISVQQDAEYDDEVFDDELIEDELEERNKKLKKKKKKKKKRLSQSIAGQKTALDSNKSQLSKNKQDDKQLGMPTHIENEVDLPAPPHLMWNPPPYSGKDAAHINYAEFDLRQKIYACLAASGFFEVLDEIVADHIQDKYEKEEQLQKEKNSQFNIKRGDKGRQSIKSASSTTNAPNIPPYLVPAKQRSMLTAPELSILMKIQAAPIFSEVEQWDALFAELVVQDDLRPVSPDAIDMMERAEQAKELAAEIHEKQIKILLKQETDIEESANEFFGSKIGGAKKLASSKVDARLLNEVLKKANPPHPIVFDAASTGKVVPKGSK
ncbi:MAG: hypothetical protein EZS28_037739, partial [Streblomastix strix]